MLPFAPEATTRVTSRVRLRAGERKEKVGHFASISRGIVQRTIKKGAASNRFPDESRKYRGNVPLVERAVLIAADSLGK